uniref:Uncharacterized protein n=1 Tax=Knipowitschia caucasica TaxID=637954 RepID=A0AAV2MCV3_KNICA
MGELYYKPLQWFRGSAVKSMRRGPSPTVPSAPPSEPTGLGPGPERAMVQSCRGGAQPAPHQPALPSAHHMPCVYVHIVEAGVRAVIQERDRGRGQTDPLFCAVSQTLKSPRGHGTVSAEARGQRTARVTSSNECQTHRQALVMLSSGAETVTDVLRHTGARFPQVNVFMMSALRGRLL